MVIWTNIINKNCDLQVYFILLHFCCIVVVVEKEFTVIIAFLYRFHVSVFINTNIDVRWNDMYT